MEKKKKKKKKKRKSVEITESIEYLRWSSACRPNKIWYSFDKPLVELELQCNSALKESAPNDKRMPFLLIIRRTTNAAVKHRYWLSSYGYSYIRTYIQGSSLSISSQRSVILQVDRKSAMHGGLTEPSRPMYIVYNYVRPGSSGTWSFWQARSLSVRWPCAGTWVYGGST